MPKRCALGCSNKNSYHQFPHPEKNPDRFKAWVHIAGGKLDSPADYELYRKKVICDIHFTDRDRNRNNRLNFLAVPSLHLPGKSDEVRTSDKVLLAPDPVNEESSLATLKPTLTDSRAGIIASGHIYCPLPKTAIKEKQSKSDGVGIPENALLVPEPVNEERSLATLKPTLTGSVLHVFPNPNKFPEQFNAWVRVVSGQDECDLDYKKLKICDRHFTQRDRNRNNRVNALAVPSLFLDGKVHHFPSQEYSFIKEKFDQWKIVLSEIDRERGKPAVDSSHKEEELPSKPVNEEGRTQDESQPILDLPSESNQYLTEPRVLSDDKSSTHVSPMSEIILDFPSPMSKETFTFSGALDITSAKTSPLTSQNKSIRYEPSASRQTVTVMCPDWVKTDWVKKNHLIEHNYCAQDKTDVTKAGESKYHQPIPPGVVNQLQTARKRVKQLQSEIIRLRKRNKVITTRLINAKNNSKHNCLQKITQKMTAAAKVFTHMQFTQTQKRSGGRRFTTEGQQLCHSIYKCSPQCYDLLSKVFTLPSAKTLKRFMRKQFDIQPGVNNGLGEGHIQPETF